VLIDFDATLTQLLVKRVPLDPAQVDISAECPTRAWTAHLVRPTVSAYLYHIRKQTNAAATKNGQPPAPHGPTNYDLCYLLTVWANSPRQEHDLLWRLLMALAREAVIAPDLLVGSLQQLVAPIKTTTAQWDGALLRAAEMWSTLDNVLKPSILFTATLPIALRPAPEAAAPVLTRMITTGSTGKPSTREPLIAIGGIVRLQADAEGAPQRAIADAEVSFPDLGVDAVTDGDGRYVIVKIPVGTHRVHVTTPEGLRMDTTVKVPAPNYNLEVQREAAVVVP
jgi:hypothetical protein